MGSYLRRIDSCITQIKAQGPSRTCNESKEEEEEFSTYQIDCLNYPSKPFTRKTESLPEERVSSWFAQEESPDCIASMERKKESERERERDIQTARDRQTDRDRVNPSTLTRQL